MFGTLPAPRSYATPEEYLFPQFYAHHLSCTAITDVKLDIALTFVDRKQGLSSHPPWFVAHEPLKAYHILVFRICGSPASIKSTGLCPEF